MRVKVRLAPHRAGQKSRPTDPLVDIQSPRAYVHSAATKRRTAVLGAHPGKFAVVDGREPKSARLSITRMSAKRNRIVAHDNREIAAVFAGGAAGTLLRAALSTWLPTKVGDWPWATFGVNIVGAFMVGYFTTRLLERLPLSNYRRPLLGTGLCGGLTTFSTMQVETLHMLEAHDFGLATAYVMASAIGGLLAVRIASAAVRRVAIGGRT